jgi:hexosaminidase
LHLQYPNPGIIPQPNSIEVTKGSFTINSSTRIMYPDVSLLPLAELIGNNINKLASYVLKTVEGDEGNNSLILSLDSSLEGEEYKIDIDKNIVLSAGNYKALSSAAASLIQLINQDKKKFTLPHLSIVDKPDYDYRAVMLDLARFWHPVETIKETIDLLWYYKIPYLQLHLSDNRRFTFPMDEYPDLKKIMDDGSREYYTKEELTKLVKYAEHRGVAIIPEIDLPGHSAQLFTKYPETFGTIDPKTGKAKYMHVVNIAKEECYSACENIINQLAEVFYTSPYIHFGGDEVYLEALKQVPEYKDYCKRHGLNEAMNGNAQELFCHFINRLHEMVKATGKKTIIWEGFHGDGAGKVKIDKDITVRDEQFAKREEKLNNR